MFRENIYKSRKPYYLKEVKKKDMFLETLAIGDLAAGGIGAGLLAAIAAFVIFFILLAIAIYVYMSFAFRAIARKVGYPSPNIAWIPLVGPALILARTAGMHWWPILLLIGFVIPFVGWICFIAFMVFWTVWLWKTFEVLGRPGWWAILSLINILMYIFIGIAAWGHSDKERMASRSMKVMPKAKSKRK